MDNHTPEMKDSSSSDTENYDTARRDTMSLAKDVRNESSMGGRLPDLSQGPATKDLGFTITGWTTNPDESTTSRRSVRLGEYPLILSSKHFGESHYVTIMFASQEALSQGRSIVPVTCPVCNTLLIRDHLEKVDLCLRCNKQMLSRDDLSAWQPLPLGDYYQFLSWAPEPARLVSFPIDCLRDGGITLLLDRCPDCRNYLTIFQRRRSCLWCGMFLPDDYESRPAYHVELLGSECSYITFQAGGCLVKE